MPTTPALAHLAEVLAYGDRSADTPDPQRELQRRVHALESAAARVLAEVDARTLVPLPAPVARDGVAPLAQRVAESYTAGTDHPEPAQAFIAEALVSSYFRHQVENLVVDTDRLLRQVVADAAGSLHDLADHARLPDPRSRRSLDQAPQELSVLAARLGALGDATVHAAYLGRHDAPAVPEGHMAVDVELLAQVLTDAGREQADPVARVRRLVLGFDAPAEG